MPHNISMEEEIINYKLQVKGLTLRYGKNVALDNISFNIHENEVTALVGPSGCGKSTLLRCFNRMNDLIDDVHIEGEIILDNKRNLLSKKIDVTTVRRKVGMVFQKPNPFPKSIKENISYGLRINGIKNSSIIDETVEATLTRVGLWQEVKDRLNDSATSLSGGQAQRLCIARTIATQPEVILMDEPTSALDPISTQTIEELILELKETYTVVIVTHNMQQAARVSDNTAFLYLGELIEYNPTNRFFTNPEEELTENYITGRFG